MDAVARNPWCQPCPWLPLPQAQNEFGVVSEEILDLDVQQSVPSTRAPRTHALTAAAPSTTTASAAESITPRPSTITRTSHAH